MARLFGEGVLIVWVDLDPAVLATADRWYIDEHLPERITEASYLRARRYRALTGTPAYMALFEATTPEALASDGYRRVTAKISTLSRQIRANFRRCIRSTHRVLASRGIANGGAMLCARLEFAGDAERAAYELWARTAFADWVRAQPTIVAAHALTAARAVRERMDSFRATGHQDEWADGVLLFEVGRPEDADALRPRLAAPAFMAAGVPARSVELGTYALMVEFTADTLAGESLDADKKTVEETT